MTALTGYVSHTIYGDGNAVVVVSAGANDARAYLTALPEADRGGADAWSRLLKLDGDGFICGPTAWKHVSGETVTPTTSAGGDRDPNTLEKHTGYVPEGRDDIGIPYEYTTGSAGGSLKGC